MLGREAAERADDGAELGLATVAGEHAEKVAGERIKAEPGNWAAKALPASSRDTSGLAISSAKSFKSSKA